jgi:hypothetical protein
MAKDIQEPDLTEKMRACSTNVLLRILGKRNHGGEILGQDQERRGG